MMIKEMAHEAKPRERLKKYGVEKLSNEELIAILLRTGTNSYSVKELALKVLAEFENINTLNDLSLNRIMKIKGIGEAKAMSLLAALELGKRVYLENNSQEKIKILNGLTVYNLFKYLCLEKQENLIVILLDNKNYLIKSETIFKGTINSSIVHPREIFNFAIKNSASSIIIVHNHPSGDVEPSLNDINFTKKIFQTGDIIGIPVIDHIIIGNNKYYTFVDEEVVDI